MSLRTRCNQPRQRTEDRCRVVEHLPDESRRCNVWSGHCIQHGRQFGKLPLSLWIHGRASFCTGRCISVQLVEKNVGQSKHWPVSLGHVHPPLGNAKHIFWVLNQFFLSSDRYKFPHLCSCQVGPHLVDKRMSGKLPIAAHEAILEGYPEWTHPSVEVVYTENLLHEKLFTLLGDEIRNSCLQVMDQICWSFP